MRRRAIAQFYRRGKKSLGRRDFSSSDSNIDGGYMEQARSVMTNCFARCLRLAFGAGTAAVAVRIFGDSNVAMAKEIERDGKILYKELEALERAWERDQKYYGITSSAKRNSA